MLELLLSTSYTICVKLPLENYLIQAISSFISSVSFLPNRYSYICNNDSINRLFSYWFIPVDAVFPLTCDGLSCMLKSLTVVSSKISKHQFISQYCNYLTTSFNQLINNIHNSSSNSKDKLQLEQFIACLRGLSIRYTVMFKIDVDLMSLCSSLCNFYLSISLFVVESLILAVEQ